MKIEYTKPSQGPSFMHKKKRKKSFDSIEDKIKDELKTYLKDDSWEDHVDEDENNAILPKLIVPHCEG